MVGRASGLGWAGIGFNDRRVRNDIDAQTQLVARVFPRSQNRLRRGIRDCLLVTQVDARVLQMSAQQPPHAVDSTRGINLRRCALVSYQRAAGPAGPGNVALYPVKADSMMSLQPSRHAGKEIRIVVPAEGVEVQTPLGDDDGFARKLGEPGCPVQSARVGRQGLLPAKSPVERAG